MTTLGLAVGGSYFLVCSAIIFIGYTAHTAGERGLARELELQKEVEKRVRAEEELCKARDEMEFRVEQRTQELNRALEAQEREKRHFREVLESLPVCVALLTADHQISFANRMFLERFGESRGRPCFEAIFGLSSPCEFCDNYQPLETKALHGWECAGPDGSVYQVFIFPYRDSEGSNLIMEVQIDITELKRAQVRLSEQAELLRLAHDAILVIDWDGKVSFWNQGAEEIYQWQAEEAVGENVHELLKTEFPAPLDEIRASIQCKGQWEGELTHVTRSGQTVIVTSRWSLQHDNAGVPNTILEINRDITERKGAEAALAQASRDLTRSNAELQQFAYVASHDLQEPLRMVANFTQLVAERYGPQLDDDAREFIAYAVAGANQMRNLIQDLLAYSRVGTQGRNFEPVDCNKALERAVSNLQVSVAENAAEVSHEVLPVISADRTQLVQLFQNLVGNGVKFRGTDPPRVAVSAVRKDNEWVFSVRDNGIGIEPQYNERIFVVFQRLHRSETYPGTGIGLALCKKIVERHGGKIWVESRPGAGSTFSFSIPAAGGQTRVAMGELEVTRDA